jgi:hypothetical protein
MSFSLITAQVLGSRRARVIIFTLVLLLLASGWLSSTAPDFTHHTTYTQPAGSYVETNPADLVSPAKPGSSAKPVLSTDCRSLPGAEDVLIVFKTGASEIYDKLPEHFETLLRCAPNSLILSDVEHAIGNYYAYDALADVSEQVKKSQQEFQFYDKINRLAAAGQDLAMLKGDKAWDLDKWKFLPMVRRAYRMHPKLNWFFFIEGDTAVLWTNLLQWLSRLNPADLIYTGSQNSLGDITFAHGGSGILVSQAAIRKLEENYHHFQMQWDNDTSNTCCGDSFLAKAFLDSGVPMTPSFPLIQGESPGTIDWNARHMCAPSVTWHHVSSRDIDILWHLQQNWTNTKVRLITSLSSVSG